MIVNKMSLESDQLTKRILIKALKLAIETTASEKDKKQFNAVLIVLELEQSELPL